MRLSVHTICVPDYPDAGQHLLYNTRSQALVQINDELKRLLDRLGDDATASLPQAYAGDIRALHANGILAQDEAEDLDRLRTHMAQIKYGVNTRVLALTILTTYTCNFRCTYCFEESSRVNEKMSFPTADLTMAWIKRKMQELRYGSLHLNFYGGEPLLNRPILEYIARVMNAWCESQGVPFKFMIQTNGYLLTPELVDSYLPLGLANVRISVDGVGEHHDRQRPLRGGGGTFKTVMDNVVRCCGKVPIGLSVGFEGTDVSHIERLLAYCRDRGVLSQLGRFIFSPIHATLGPAGQAEKIQNAHCQCTYGNAELVEANTRIQALMEAYGLDTKNGMSTSVCPVTRHESGGTIDQRGRIYKCNSMLGHEDLATGHVGDEEYNAQHYRFLNIDVFNQCPQDCTYMPMCSGGCRLTSFLDTKNYRTPSCHKPYLNVMAPRLIKAEYHRLIKNAPPAAVTF